MLDKTQDNLCDTAPGNYGDLSALFINCTLKYSPEQSHTDYLIDMSATILEKNGVAVERIRANDYDSLTVFIPT